MCLITNTVTRINLRYDVTKLDKQINFLQNISSAIDLAFGQRDLDFDYISKQL